MKKVLLTSICRPIGERYGDGPSVGYELLHGQVTRSQGLFSPRANHLQYSLEYIAENIEAPAVVLHYPSKAELVRELKKGYDFIGVPFVLSTFHRMKETVALVRKHAPRTKIILGGYGTVADEENLKAYGDYICREEGVGFMRRLLGEPELPLSGHKHPLVVSRMKLFGALVSNTGLIFGGLGCPHGCDFCCTSHFFKRRHIKLLQTGRDIYRVMERYLDLDKEMSFVVLDEDFLVNKQRAMEFRDCVKQGGRAVSLFCFGSVKAISQYTVEELLEMGIDGFWIGYEGARSGYAKREGKDPEALFHELRQNGIMVLASMIVGFDYQDQKVIEEEFDGLMALKPSLSQFLIYGPTPGTPFYDRVMKEDRLREGYKEDFEGYCRQAHGFTSMVRHPTMSYEQVEASQRRCFDEDFERLGPSIYRVMETWFNGYKKSRDSANAILKDKAARFAADLRKSYPAFLPGRLLGPNARVRDAVAQLEREIHAELGAPTWKERVLSWVSLCLAAWSGLALRYNLFQHPSLIRTAFRLPARKWGDFKLWERLPAQVASPEFNLRVDLQHARQRVWLKLEGKLAGSQAERLWQQIREVMARRRTEVVLDLKQLQFDDFAALKTLRERLVEYRSRVRLVMPKLAHAHPEVLILARLFHQYKDSLM